MNVTHSTSTGYAIALLPQSLIFSSKCPTQVLLNFRSTAHSFQLMFYSSQESFHPFHPPFIWEHTMLAFLLADHTTNFFNLSSTEINYKSQISKIRCRFPSSITATLNYVLLLQYFDPPCQLVLSSSSHAHLH